MLNVLEQLPSTPGRATLPLPYRVGGLLALAGLAPYRRSGVRLVPQHIVERSLVPALASIGDAPVVQLLAQLLEAAAPQGLV